MIVANLECFQAAVASVRSPDNAEHAGFTDDSLGGLCAYSSESHWLACLARCTQ
jgi:hypothetical protein